MHQGTILKITRPEWPDSNLLVNDNLRTIDCLQLEGGGLQFEVSVRLALALCYPPGTVFSADLSQLPQVAGQQFTIDAVLDWSPIPQWDCILISVRHPGWALSGIEPTYTVNMSLIPKIATL
jgi:hypothetical protein